MDDGEHGLYLPGDGGCDLADLMDRHSRLRRGLTLSGLVMLVGIVMLETPLALAWIAPPWWTTAGALVTLSGAAAELLTVWRFCRERP